MHCCLRRFVPFFSLFMVLWGVLFVRYWERESSSLACMWKTLDWEKREVPNPDFYGHVRLSPVRTPTCCCVQLLHGLEWVPHARTLTVAPPPPMADHGRRGVVLPAVETEFKVLRQRCHHRLHACHRLLRYGVLPEPAGEGGVLWLSLVHRS